jgi:hypothetical protein
MTEPNTRQELHGLRAPLLTMRRASAVMGAAGVALLILGGTAWVADLGWFAPPYWVLVSWFLVIVASAALILIGWRHRSLLSTAAVARFLESQPRWRSGQLLAFLDRPASGTSPSLFAAADREEAQALAREGPDALMPLRHRWRARLLQSAALLSLGVLALMSAGPFDGRAAALWHPGAAWRATTAPVRVDVAQHTIDRGQAATIELHAVGRRTATLWTRTPGESWRPQTVALDSLGAAVVSSGPLYADLLVRATAGRRESNTLTVTVRLPAFLGALTVTARYPRYLGLQAEPIPVSGDTILLPVGTSLEVRGEATAELGDVVWHEADRRYPLETAGKRFSGSFHPQRSGRYTLSAMTVAGAPLSGDTVALPLLLVPDGPPVVAVPVPGRDTLAPTSLRLPLVIDVQDDYGIRVVRLTSRRVSRVGLVDTLPVVTIPLSGANQDRAILTHLFDLNDAGLLPGDTVRYAVEAVDNAPNGQVGRSPEYLLRVPTMSEVRAAARAASDDVSERLDSLAAASKALERQTEDLSRERQRSDSQGTGDQEDQLSFDDAQRAEQAAAAQQELLREAEELQQALQALQEGAREAGLNDPDWQARLDEVRNQLERAMSPELRERLDELQRALQDLDADRTREALEDLSEAQRELREAIERSRELFRRAALEGDLSNLSDEAEELARDQERWNDEVTRRDSTSAAAIEEALAARADSLRAALEELGSQLQAEGMQDALEQAAERAAMAGQQMQQAAQQAQAGDMSGAQQSGQQAMEQLQPLGEELQQQQNRLQEQWRQEVVEALDQGLAETSRLLERQLQVEQSARVSASPTRQRAEQGAVEEGVERMMERMQQLSGTNALVSPDIATALSAAKEEMRQSREALATAATNEREAADRAGRAADALNAAAYVMLRSRNDVDGSGSGSGLSEAMERMNQLAQQQGQMSQQAGSLLPMVGQSGMQQELRRLSDDQRQLAEELERLQAQANMPQAGALAEEARELARRLEAGRLDRDTVRRQEQLFRRLLDQGRTLQGQEEDDQKERQSETPESADLHLPPALRAMLPAGDDRLTLPSWEELQRFTPEERRLVVEYFRRLTDAQTP